jgi:hypothetical protein
VFIRAHKFPILIYSDIDSSYMSLVFLTNPTKMCLRFDSSSLPSISLNNSEIGTLINIYPPTQNIPIRPINLHKYNSSDITTQAFYHLLNFQHQQTNDRGIKRSNNSESFSSRKRQTIASQQRFNFAKLADEVIKDKEDISNSSLSFDTSSLSTPSPQSAPAAITSGVSLLSSTTHS